MSKQENVKKIEASEEKEKKGKSKKYVIASIILLLVLIFFTLRLIWNYFQRPVSSNSIRFIQAPVTEVKKDEKTYEPFAGRYVSFEHEGTYQEKTHTSQENSGQKFLEMAFWAEEKEIAKKLALTVETIENGNLSASSSYLMRDSSPQLYQKETVKVGDNQAVTFTAKSGSFEKAGFVQKGDMLAILVLSAPMSESSELDEEFKKVLDSLKWR